MISHVLIFAMNNNRKRITTSERGKKIYVNNKKRNRKRQERRYKIPDWPTTVQNLLSFTIDSNGKVKRLLFSTQQRPQYSFLSESVTRLMITELCNYFGKLVETPYPGFYWSSHSTNGQFNNTRSIVGLLNNMKSIIN